MSFLCTIPLLNALLSSCLPPLPLATGYVEGEYVLLAPVETARIERIDVRRGDHIDPEQGVVFLERQDAEIAVAQARAALVQAESGLANISQGRRAAEIAAIEASVASARANATEAKREMVRQKDLLNRGLIPQAQYDQTVTRSEVANAQVAVQEANLAVARLPARPDEIKAAKAAVDQAAAQLEQAEWRLSRRTLAAIGPGTVFDVIRNPGEVAGPQAPVLSILPDNGIKLRLYVPESSIAQVGIGSELDVSCDNCASIRATVSYVAAGPEFTPPVIYSLENRQKLVYLVEARVDGNETGLKPGQIVNVDLRDVAK